MRTQSDRADHLGGNHAVVIGASDVGLLAARTLAGHLDRVTVVECHRLPSLPPSAEAGLYRPTFMPCWPGGRPGPGAALPLLFADLEKADAVRSMPAGT